MVRFRQYLIGARVKCADDPAKNQHDLAKYQGRKRGKRGKDEV